MSVFICRKLLTPCHICAYIENYADFQDVQMHINVKSKIENKKYEEKILTKF